METAEQIKLKIAQMKLTALENEYCNTNWTFNVKLKSLRQELDQKTRRQNMLNSQLAALKKCFADHQNEIKCLMSQVAEVNDEKEYKSRKQGESPNISTKNIRYSPKNITKGLFFKVTRTDHKKINFSPSITRTQLKSPTNKVNLAAQETRINPQKRATIRSVKSNLILQGVLPQKTLQLARSLQQLKQSKFSPDLTKKFSDKSNKDRICFDTKNTNRLKRKNL